jgi:hypothetical protein
VFLETIRFSPSKTQSVAAPSTPADPIPVAEWAQIMNKRVADVAAMPGIAAKQTVKADGKPRADQVAINADEPIAKRFDMPTPPKGTSPLEISVIAREFNVPPIRPDLTDANLAELPYLESVMKEYKEDVPLEEILKDKEKYKFRATVLDAFETIRNVWAGDPMSGGLGKLDVTIMAPITDDIKRQINTSLEAYAFGIAKLELSDIQLDGLESMKAGETKRWQAHYEYARAVVKSRLAYLNEYNKLMGDVRTETLPERTPDQDRYQLASSEKMKSKKEVQMLAEQAQEAYARLITEHKGTPWAIQAKREKNFSLGLVWRPVSSAAATAEPK